MKGERSSMLSITKIFKFEAAHAISCYDGKCKNIHGHSYELHVTVSGKDLNESNMLIDFKDMKKVVEDLVIRDFDHSLMLKENDKNKSSSSKLDTKILWLEEEPTAEFMLLEILKRIGKQFPKNINLKRLKLYETATCYAEWDMD